MTRPADWMRAVKGVKVALWLISIPFLLFLSTLTGKKMLIHLDLYNCRDCIFGVICGGWLRGVTLTSFVYLLPGPGCHLVGHTYLNSIGSMVKGTYTVGGWVWPPSVQCLLRYIAMAAIKCHLYNWDGSMDQTPLVAPAQHQAITALVWEGNSRVLMLLTGC